MRFHFLPIILFLTLIYSPATAQNTTEERILVHNLPPSLILQRIDVLAGLPSGGTHAFEIVPDDKTNAILVRIPDSYKDAMERERIVAILRDFVKQIDRPEPRMTVDIYVVETDLLNDDEYRLLDDTLKKRALALERGSTAKGVVAYQQLIAPNQEIVVVDQTIHEARAQTRPEPVRLSGKFLAALQDDKSTYMSADLKITATDRPLAPGKMEVPVGGKAITNAQKPIIFFAGELKALADGKPDTFPARHEVMVYIWAAPEK